LNFNCGQAGSDTTGDEERHERWGQNILKQKLNKKLLYVYFQNTHNA